MILSDCFEEALTLAVRLHASQVRKGTAVPYIAHLLAVASLVLEQGADEDEVIAALLHDAVEDQGGEATLEEIRRRFGDRVAEIVDGCTDARTTPKPPWRGRKEAYLAHLSQAPAAVRLVSTADKLHNARTILADYRTLGEALWERFNGGREGTLWYYRSLVEAFRATGPSPLVEELDRVVLEIERLASADGEGQGPALASVAQKGSMKRVRQKRRRLSTNW
jgi:GTP pyrophosphokinase